MALNEYQTNPSFYNVRQMHEFAQSKVLAFEQQTQIYILALTILLMQLQTSGAMFSRKHVKSLFGDRVYWHDTLLDLNRSPLLVGHEIRLSEDSVDAICNSIGMCEQQQDSEDSTASNMLFLAIQNHLGWSQRKLGNNQDEK